MFRTKRAGIARSYRICLVYDCWKEYGERRCYGLCPQVKTSVRGRTKGGIGPHTRQSLNLEKDTTVTETKCEPHIDPEESDDDWTPEEATIMPIDGILDLHTFSPRDVRELLEDYVTACLNAGILDVRIIHGKGKGIVRERVRSILQRMPQVQNWSEAPLEAGGWGATLVRLKQSTGN